MADLPEGEVVLDIDDSAERPASEHGGDSDDDDQGEAATSQQGDDDSIHLFTGHRGPVFAAAWNQRHQSMVATGGGDDTAFIWQTGNQSSPDFEATTLALRGHTDSVASLQFNNEGDLLASGGLEGQVKIWAASSGECLRTLEGPVEGIEWLSWHPKGNILLAGSEDFSVWMWNASTGACMQVFTGHSGPVRCGSFTPDGRQIVTGGGDEDHSLKVWDPKSGACALSVQDLHTFHTAGLTSMDIRQDSSTACTGSEDCTAHLVNLQTGRVLGSLRGHTDSVEAVRFVNDSSLVATCSLDGTLRVWETSTLTLRATCTHDQGVVGLLCHPRAPFLFTSCLDGFVRSWDARTGGCLQAQRGHDEGIQALSLSPDGQLALTGSDDHTAKVFEFDFTSSMH